MTSPEATTGPDGPPQAKAPSPDASPASPPEPVMGLQNPLGHEAPAAPSALRPPKVEADEDAASKAVLQNMLALPSLTRFLPDHQYPPELMAMVQLTRMREQVAPLRNGTVAPAEMSLLPTPHERSHLLSGANGSGADGLPSVNGSPGLESFARIEFADSTFQMTTYTVVIGRDQRAMQQARIDERRRQDYIRRKQQCEALGLPPPTPPSQTQGKFSKSYVSEEGGMLGPEPDDDDDDNPRPAKRRRISGAQAGPQPHQQRAEAGHDAAAPQRPSPNLVSTRQYVSHTPGAATVDLASLRPSPYHVPFIGIHSPGPDIASKTRAISRKHLQIQFNPEKSVFEARPLHKNGFFIQDILYKDHPVVLRSGDKLQIKDVNFTFIINGAKPGQASVESELDDDDDDECSSKRYSEGGKEMSFEFESSHPDEDMRSTSEEMQEAEPEGSDDDESGDEEGDEEEEDADEVMETVESDEPEAEPEPEPELPPPPPKKRGPGRPPKNGVMSKREERLRKKMALEEAKKNMPQPPPGDPPVKRKVGRPRKHPLPENAPERPEKRKYKPRKPKNPEDGAGSDAEKAVKEKRREKPKTPPLNLNPDDFTPQQREKPNKNYGVLIDEVLRDAPQGLSLKQIYKRIQQKYPFYYFTVGTKGWESSVRHNLIGNDAFKKNEETHLWSRVPGIELDAGKKRKANSPDNAASGLHGLGPHWNPQVPHPLYQAEHVAAGGQGHRPVALPPHGLPPNGNQSFNGLPAQTSHATQQQPAVATGATTSQAGARPGYPLQPQPSGAGQLSGYGPAAAARQAPGDAAQPPSYSSPYVAKASATSTPGADVGQPVAPGQRPPQAPVPAARTMPGNLPPQGGPQAGVAPPAAAANGAGVKLKPAINPEVTNFISNFKNTVMSQLAKRFPNNEAIAMYIVNRGLGLSTATSPILEGHGDIESVVFNVFQTAKQKYEKPQVVDQRLVETLTGFKGEWVQILQPKLGAQKSEDLLLSAIDRVLGFTERSLMSPGSDMEKDEFEKAEKLLMPLIRARVEDFRRSITFSR